MKNEQMQFVEKHDLKALLFWANVGVRLSVAGGYMDIVEILPAYAKLIRFHLPPTKFKGE